ncbi:MAG: hypothetical protein ACOYU3_04700 [Bacillota bacterium]
MNAAIPKIAIIYVFMEASLSCGRTARAQYRRSSPKIYDSDTVFFKEVPEALFFLYTMHKTGKNKTLKAMMQYTIKSVQKILSLKKITSTVSLTITIIAAKIARSRFSL